MAPTAMEKTSPRSALQELADLHGIEIAYEDVFGRRHEASPEALLRVLQILGSPLQRTGEAPEALRAQRLALARRGLEPVTIAWDGACDGVIVRLPQREATGLWRCTLHTEQGEERRWDVDARQLPIAQSCRLDKTTYVTQFLPLRGAVPHGYHRLELEIGGQLLQTLLISAPIRAYTRDAGDPQRTWGVFLPLYALNSQRSWGVGDFTDLRDLLSWVGDQGGEVAATLPMMAAFLDEPFDCSPYSPVSRLFWNELYLDVEALSELRRSPAARDIVASPGFAIEREALQALSKVDYRRAMALKRRVLSEMARCFFQECSERHEAFERFIAAHPQVEDYARFRAVGERLRTPWPQWPAALRDGTITPGDYDEEVRRYHLYVQWACEQQLQTLTDAARRIGPGLYLDLPLGVHAYGYDVWRERDAFAIEASGGAPPDAVFTRGQDWGFPPLHPARIRDQGYRYVLNYLRRQLMFAGMLRIDHMPGFHRLFWIPHGLDAHQGVYVRYPAEELYALFSLESHRHRAMLVGEDLGTVPPEVPESMARHSVHRMYVVQYCLQDDPKEALPPIPAASIASINTHDMPPFAAFLAGEDIRQREALGLLGDQELDKELERRQAMIEAMIRSLRSIGRLGESAEGLALLRACLNQLAGSEAHVVLANLEDLWL